MSISTPLTALLGITHPILSAPMDVIAGARLTAAVSAAGGLGILGGGYGDKNVAGAGDRQAQRRISSLRHRLHHLEPGQRR